MQVRELLRATAAAVTAAAGAPAATGIPYLTEVGVIRLAALPTETACRPRMCCSS